MPRLVIGVGSPAAREIHLKPGTNSIGRAATNDFPIPEASISGAHCQIVVDEGGVSIRDLGSTNGTFVNRTRIVQAALQNGQSVRLGEIEMVFYADATGANASSRPAIPVAVALPLSTGSAPEATKSIARTEALLVAAPVPTRTAVASSPPAIPLEVAAPPPPGPMAKVVVAQFCRFHPKQPAQYHCSTCRHYFCEVCVAVRKVEGATRKFCRHCDTECTPVQVQLHPAEERGFLGRAGAGFLYPLRGAGFFIVLAGIIILGLVELGTVLVRVRTLRTVPMGCIMIICAGGYLFTYLQSILHSTAAEDKELPTLPGISNFADDVVFPFFRLLALNLMCFGPLLGTAVWFALTNETSAFIAFIAAAIFGGFYFPMAFLAVAILDSLAAANPIMVVSSIFKVPFEYFFALGALGLALGVDFGGTILVAKIFPDGWQTTSMGVLFAMIAIRVFRSILTMYLLLVAIHILGLVFAVRKDKLGWLAT